MEQPLDNLEIEVEKNKALSRGIEKLLTLQKMNALEIKALTDRQTRIEQAFEELLDFNRELLEAMKEMQSEVRGLQTESQRIVETFQRDSHEGKG